jgi:hypothetical protein
VNDTLGRISRSSLEAAVVEVSRLHPNEVAALDSLGSLLVADSAADVSIEAFLQAARWSGPDRALAATLILRAAAALDVPSVEGDGMRVVFGDLTTDVLEIDDELVVVLGDLRASALAMQFRGSGIGELWVAGNARIGVIESDESICIAGFLHADAVWGKHNDGSIDITGTLEADVVIAHDHVIAAATEQIGACWDAERNRLEFDAIRARLVPDALGGADDRPTLNWRRVIARGERVVRPRLNETRHRC